MLTFNDAREATINNLQISVGRTDGMTTARPSGATPLGLAVSPGAWYTRSDGSSGTITGINIATGTLNDTNAAGGSTVTANLMDNAAIVAQVQINVRSTAGDGTNFNTTPGPAPSVTWTGPYYNPAAGSNFSFTLGSTLYNLNPNLLAGRIVNFVDRANMGSGITKTVDFRGMSGTQIYAAIAGSQLVTTGIPSTNAVYGAASNRQRSTGVTVTDMWQYKTTPTVSMATMQGLFSGPVNWGSATNKNVALSFVIGAGGALTFDAGTAWNLDGSSSAVSAAIAGNLLAGGTITLSNGASFNFSGGNPADINTFEAGDKFSLFLSGEMGADVSVTVSGGGGNLNYNLSSSSIKNKTFDLLRYTYNTNGDTITSGARVTVPWNFSNVRVGDIAKTYTKLYDLESFWNSEGRFLLDDPKTVTITQGDGKQAQVTFYADDTVQNFVDKLNRAIGEGLGQARYYTALPPKFAVYVSSAIGGAVSVAGTVVLSSIIPGAEGRLTFSGDEDIIKALGLNVIGPAAESAYTVRVEDAHTGAVVVPTRQVTGNKLIGDIHSNVDLVFDSMSGVVVTYISATGNFRFSAGAAAVTYLHLKDNTTVLQIGANEGEDMGLHIGDMRSYALGLNRVLVVSRAAAARSITLIDNAIDRVSTQRARLGAYQNRLEHTINNLTVAGQNLTASESRIRDTDMAKEMMNFTKLQILLQAGTSMLAQANSLPRNVLSLFS